MYRLFIILSCLAPVVTVAQVEGFIAKRDRLLREAIIDSVKVPVLRYEFLMDIKDSIELCIYTDTVREKDGSYGIGRKTLGPSITYLFKKIGDWTYYYPDSTLFARGSYSIGAKMVCQAGGPTGSGYTYQSRFWQYWYPNGQLMAEGRFRISPISVESDWGGCRSAIVAKPELNNDWKYYNEQGASVELNDTICATIFSPAVVR
jgi:hypothetical protein